MEGSLAIATGAAGGVAGAGTTGNGGGTGFDVARMDPREAAAIFKAEPEQVATQLAFQELALIQVGSSNRRLFECWEMAVF